MIRVRVVDANGEPTNAVDVATFWSANGQQWHADGSFPDLQTATSEAMSEYWDDEGEMMAFPNRLATRVGNGEFRVTAALKKPHMVLALNPERTLGGLAYSDAESKGALRIALQPLVHVFGKIRCDDEIPVWTYACIFPGTLREAPD